MWPLVGWSKPAISRRQVVLPEPDGPSIAKNSPSAIVSETSSTARTDAEVARDVLEGDGGDHGGYGERDLLPGRRWLRSAG